MSIDTKRTGAVRSAAWMTGILAAALVGFVTAPALQAEVIKAPATDIVDTAVAAGSFKILAAALQAAGLIDALKAKGPFTVFAPTDEAFANLPKGTVEDLLKPENKDKLKGILLYHVVSGKIASRSIRGSASPKTLQGSSLDVNGSKEGVTVNGAKVTSADIKASNGVIHVIDTVLLPPAG
jgi:uncharacterized surface protein with fasciclin (FAS1) repeats